MHYVRKTVHDEHGHLLSMFEAQSLAFPVAFCFLGLLLLLTHLCESVRLSMLSDRVPCFLKIRSERSVVRSCVLLCTGVDEIL